MKKEADSKENVKENKGGILNNFIWRLFERFGANFVTFIVSIVLARILDPEAYGIVALITAIVTILQVFVDSGLGNALIQKKDSDEKDFSTVFYFNIFSCTIIYLLLFFLAPLIASFFSKYDQNLLKWLIRVSSINILIAGVKNIQQAYVAKNMIFKKFFFATLGGTIGAAFIGIFLAIKGFGPWALICQLLFNSLVDTIILWITVRWRPIRFFSFERLKILLRFGWKLLVTNLLRTGYTEVRSLVIGKCYSAEDLAYYNKGNLFPKTIINNVDSAIDSVLLPSMSKVQTEKVKVKELTRKSIKISTFLIFPMMAGLALCAEPIIHLLLTDKWLPIAPFMVIFCISLALHPIHTANLNAIMSLGRSDLYLKLEIIKKCVDFAVLLISMWFGVKAIAIGFLISTVLEQIINSWPSRKLIDYSIFSQIKDLLPNLCCTLIMSAAVFIVKMFCGNGILDLLLEVATGISVYFVVSLLFKNESFKYILKKLKIIK